MRVLLEKGSEGVIKLLISNVWSHIFFHLSILSFNKYFLRAYYVMGTAIGIWNAGTRQDWKVSPLSWSPIFPSFLEVNWLWQYWLNLIWGRGGTVTNLRSHSKWMIETGLEFRACASQSTAVWYWANWQNLLGCPRFAAAPSQPTCCPSWGWGGLFFPC